MLSVARAWEAGRPRSEMVCRIRAGALPAHVPPGHGDPARSAQQDGKEL